MNKFLKLKENMLVVMTYNRYYLITGDQGNGSYSAYHLIFDSTSNTVNLSSSLSVSENDERIIRIHGKYSALLRKYIPMPPERILAITRMNHLCKDLLWERKVKEVTMREVCDKFGCEVKIVGEK